MGKVWAPISQVLLIRVLLHVPLLWEIDGKPMHFSYNEVCHIEWESNGKKAPMLWEKYEYQFPRLSPYRFCCIFPCCGNLWGKPCISHMMTLVNFFLILTIVIALFRVQYNKYYPSSSYFSNKTKYEKKKKILAIFSEMFVLVYC